MPLRRWFLFAAVALAFFAVALSGDLYNLTSPPTLSWHVMLRKAYSIVAFAVIGAVYRWASSAGVRVTSLVIAAYSSAIEVGQHFTYGLEPLVWNVIDVLCGAAGGALGAVIPWARARAAAKICVQRMRRRHPRV